MSARTDVCVLCGAVAPVSDPATKPPYVHLSCVLKGSEAKIKQGKARPPPKAGVTANKAYEDIESPKTAERDLRPEDETAYALQFGIALGPSAHLSGFGRVLHAYTEGKRLCRQSKSPRHHLGSGRNVPVERAKGILAALKRMESGPYDAIDGPCKVCLESLKIRAELLKAGYGGPF